MLLLPCGSRDKGIGLKQMPLPYELPHRPHLNCFSQTGSVTEPGILDPLSPSPTCPQALGLSKACSTLCLEFKWVVVVGGGGPHTCYLQQVAYQTSHLLSLKAIPFNYSGLCFPRDQPTHDLLSYIIMTAHRLAT